MKSRPTLLLFAVLLAGCLQSLPKDQIAPKQNLWSVAADRIDAGHWSMTQAACKDITHVAKQASVSFPDDYNSFWKKVTVPNVPLDEKNRPVISKQLREWSK